MKKRFIGTFLVLLLSITTIACSSNDGKSITDNSNADNNKVTDSLTLEPSISPTATVNEKDLAIEAYRAVLQNKSEFLNTETNKKTSLDDYLNESVTDKKLDFVQFTVLDMDGDNIPEFILELTDGFEGYFNILHYNDEQVYGYNIVYRGLKELKTDGSFVASSGAADNSINKLKFNNDSYEMIALAHSESSQEGEELHIKYYIDNQPAAEEEFYDFLAKEDEKEDATWYEVTESNIEKELNGDN